MGCLTCCSTSNTFPVRDYFLLYVSMIPSCISISYIFPFVSFFVLHLGLAAEKGKVGRMVGLVVSMYFLGRAGTSFFWGFVADRYGRKVALIISIILSGICTCGFGFSRDLWELCMWRFLAGLTNGILIAVKTMASEIATNPEDRNRGQAWTESAWSTGLIIGPAIGGCLAMPCGMVSGDALFSINWPLVLGGVFCKHPFSLPCIWCGILHLLILPCAFALPETGRRKGYAAPKIEEEQKVECIGASVMGASLDQELPEEALEQAMPGQVQGYGCQHAMADDHEATPEDVALKSESACHESNDNCTQRTYFPSWCGRDLMLLVSARCLAIMAYVMWNEILSIWCMTPRFRGGMQWSARSIGQIWGGAGVFMCVLQLWLMPVIMNAVGTWYAVVCGSMLNVPILALLPWIAVTQGLPFDNEVIGMDLDSAIADAEVNTLVPTAISFGLLFCLMCIMNVFAQMVVIGTTILIGNTVTTKYRARVNSFALGMQSLFMAFSPTLGGFIFAWGILKTPYNAHPSAWEVAAVWPFGCHPAFLLCASMQIPVSLMSLCVSRALEHSPEDEASIDS